MNNVLNWLKKKGQDARVYGCIQELRWELESYDQITRAKIFATAGVVRNEFFSGKGTPFNEVVGRPLDYTRDVLISLYETLEDIRNNNTLQIQDARERGARLEMELPDFVEEHAKIAGRALEVWMSTIGAGIGAGRRDDVRAIWSMLVQSSPYLDQAMDSILETEQMTTQMTGQNGVDVFSKYGRDEWKKLCQFLPSRLVKETESFKADLAVNTDDYGNEDDTYNAANEEPGVTSQPIKALEHDNDDVSKMIDLIAGTLSAQKALMSDEYDMLPDKAKDEWSLGYIVGYSDALLQRKGIDTDATGLAIMTIVFITIFGEEQGPTYFRKFMDLQKAGAPEIFVGMKKGGNEAFTWLSDTDKIPMGWVGYVRGIS